MDDRPRCVHCGEIVGVYEPARLLLSDGTEQHGSRLTLRDQPGPLGGILVHERCGDAFRRERGDGPAPAGA